MSVLRSHSLSISLCGLFLVWLFRDRATQENIGTNTHFVCDIHSFRNVKTSVYHSVMQCVAVCCSVLQFSVLQCVAVPREVKTSVCCSVL